MSINNIGIIGSGAIGQGIARLALAAGLSVAISNSRGPESLSDPIKNLGSNAHAATAAEEAEFGDIIILAIPLSAYAQLPVPALAGKT